jgi:type IV pilus assembly protein PilB
MGVQAALTGHLVFSTLHTNNAATCLPRLLDMGVEPFLIASTVRSVIGQRLVRHVCVSCKVAYKPDETEFKEIKHMFNLDDAAVMKRVHELEKAALAEKLGGDEAELGTNEKAVTRLYKAKEGGCEACSTTGYRGRIGIYEVLDNSTDIQDLIMNNATSDDIQKKAIDDGMVTMQLDGFVKALRGLTTVEEILRVTRE